MKLPTLTDGRRVVCSPVQHINETTAIMSAILGDDEDIEWHYVYGVDGRIAAVNGYTITKKAQI